MIGAQLQFGIQGPAGTQALVAAFAEGDQFINPYGNVLLRGNLNLVFQGPTSTLVTQQVPNVTSVRGVTVHLQALVVPVGKPGALTNLLCLTVY